MINAEVLPDIPRIYTALAEWLSCLLCLMEMKRRLRGRRFLAASFGMLIVQSLFLTMTPGLKGILWILCMAAAVGLMYIFLYIASDMNWKDVAYYCVRAFVAAEFAASLEWQVECYFSRRLHLTMGWLRLIVLVLIYGLVFYVIRKLYTHGAGSKTPLNVTNQELLACMIIGLAIFFMSNLGFVSTGTLFGGRYTEEIYNVRTWVDLGGVAIMYAYHIQRVDIRVRRELESVQNILNNQYVQFKQSREAIDMINYKYHDLKHHIIALRAEENAEKRNRYLDQMEEELLDYEAQNKTGNKTLDVMLTTKGMYCRKHGITMTSVVDGTQFEFMDTMDICSIFGNALDNAIECELKIKDKGKRLIHVTALSQKNFLMIRFENYYEGEMALGTDFPETTKEDARFHGYGLKSLRYTVEKYGGAVDLSTQEQWFQLKILIPR